MQEQGQGLGECPREPSPPPCPRRTAFFQGEPRLRASRPRQARLACMQAFLFRVTECPGMPGTPECILVKQRDKQSPPPQSLLLYVWPHNPGQHRLEAKGPQEPPSLRLLHLGRSGESPELGGEEV